MNHPATARPLVSSLASSRIRDIANAGMGRPDILPFWFGESDLPTPDFINEAARSALGEAQTFYTHNLGTPHLREAIAAYQARLHGITPAPHRIAVTGSGVSALMIADQMIVSPGDRVVVMTPVWPNIAEAPRLLGADVIRFPLTVEHGRWTLDLDRLFATLTPQTRLFILNAPNNPTGFAIDRDSQRAILDHCRKHGIWLLSDEVYERLVCDGTDTAPSIQSLSTPQDRVVVVNSFSKTWRMTGWRLGWLTLPDALMPDIAKIIEYNTSCVPAFVQAGGLAALTDPRGEESITELKAGLRRSRDLLLDGFDSFDRIQAPRSEGAMYAFFRIDGAPDDMAVATSLVTDYGLGLAPGSAFGPEGAGWLRWCYAAHPEKITEGLWRLSRFLMGR